APVHCSVRGRCTKLYSKLRRLNDLVGFQTVPILELAYGIREPCIDRGRCDIRLRVIEVARYREA
ncbi:MAG TPA: hypothetical protein VNQ14_15390, partial [Woeseiaceae bacterium]|nr:hypothetical protein [Woeseiaceae bacterium]